MVAEAVWLGVRWWWLFAPKRGMLSWLNSIAKTAHFLYTWDGTRRDKELYSIQMMSFIFSGIHATYHALRPARSCHYLEISCSGKRMEQREANFDKEWNSKNGQRDELVGKSPFRSLPTWSCLAGWIILPQTQLVWLSLQVARNRLDFWKKFRRTQSTGSPKLSSEGANARYFH